jgi:hypothetical protein
MAVLVCLPAFRDPQGGKTDEASRLRVTAARWKRQQLAVLARQHVGAVLQPTGQVVQTSIVASV